MIEHAVFNKDFKNVNAKKKLNTKKAINELSFQLISRTFLTSKKLSQS